MTDSLTLCSKIYPGIIKLLIKALHHAANLKVFDDIPLYLLKVFGRFIMLLKALGIQPQDVY